MKVVKPNALSVITRCFEHQRRHHFAISVLAFVPLTEDGDGPLLPEVSLWKTMAEQLGPAGVLEPGIPKSRGEWLVHGSAFAPGGVPRPSVPVVARVGEVDKALMVHGDRYWTPGREPSEAQPFTRVPIEWSRAYGGPKLAANPLGRGHGESEYMGQRVQMLPNLEHPDEPVVSPRDRPEPVSFGPLDISWPQRRSLAGTYDQAWTETLFPGLAADVNWRLFNLAAPDQQREGPWEGGEAFRFDNLHPTRPVLEGTVPSLRARAFLTRGPATSVPVRSKDAAPQVEGAEPSASSPSPSPSQAPPDDEDAEPEPERVELEEVPLTLRTLWFFPEIERAVLVFQGSTEVVSPEGTDVRHLLLAAEDRDQDRPPSHYAQVLQDRLDPEHGTLASLRDHELLPAGMAGVVDEGQAKEQALHQLDRRLEHNLHRRALEEHARIVAQVEDAGLDPTVVAPPEPEPPGPMPSLDELPDTIATLQNEADRRREEELAKVDQRRADLRQMMLDQGMPEAEADALLRASETGPTGPPRFTADGQRAGLVALLQQARDQGAATDELEAMLYDDEQYARWQQAEEQLRDGYRAHAHLQDPAPPMPAERSEQARVALREALDTGMDLTTLDFSGADLSGMSLRGAKLDGALLESARLDGADLRGATLRGAVLAHASLRGARFDEADLRDANLGRATLVEACLAGADMQGAVLMGADLQRAVLRGADLRTVDLFQATLIDADASEVTTEQLVLLEASVTGLNLAGADLPRATFLELDLRGVSLLGARLPQATFVGCRASGVSLAGAVIDGARFVEACDLSEASLAGANARGTNLRGVDLREAVLDHATLDGADLSEAVLRDARLYRATARGARFDGADLEDASLVAANLMQASFLGATIRGADLRGTNLYGADMARVRTDDRIRLDRANLARVRVLPRHEPGPSEEPS